MTTLKRQAGLSLVEIMVAVVIGMIGILIITQAYISSDNFNRATIGEGGAQTNGLIALYSIERDMRTSGYGISDSTALGCSEVSWHYNGTYSKNINAGSTLPRIRLAPVYITTAANSPDQVTLMYAAGNERMVPTTIKTFTAGSNLVELDSKSGFSTNDIILLVKSTGCTMARVTAVEADPSKKLQLNPGTPLNPAGWSGFPVANYAVGDLVFNLGAAPTVRTYYVSSGKLMMSDALSLAAGTADISIMDGIVDLKAQYGKDNGIDNGTVTGAAFTPNDGVVDQFSSTTPANSAEWQQIVSVRLAVLARIGTYEKPDTSGTCHTTTTAPSWSGGSFNALSMAAASEDRCYRYRVFETIVPLRNMIWRGS